MYLYLGSFHPTRLCIIIQSSNQPHSHGQWNPPSCLLPPLLLNASNQLHCPSLAFHPFIYILVEIRQVSGSVVFKVKMFHWFIEWRDNISTFHSASPSHSPVLSAAQTATGHGANVFIELLIMTLALDFSFLSLSFLVFFSLFLTQILQLIQRPSVCA